MTEEINQYLLISGNTVVDGLGNNLKGLVTSMSISDDVLISCSPSSIIGNYETVLDPIHVLLTEEKKRKQIEYVGTCRLLILKTEESLQENLPNEFQKFDGIGNKKFDCFFSNDRFIDWNYNPELIHPVVKQRILNQFDKIVFLPIVHQRVDEILKSVDQDDEILGLSIRTWRASHEKDVKRAYNTEDYKDKIKRVLEIHPYITRLMVSIDNEDALQDYEHFFDSLAPINVTILSRDDDINYLQFAIIKALVLSKCKYFIGNRISTFTELVFWFSHLNIKVYHLY